MVSEAERFVEFLSNTKKTDGNDYKASTVATYNGSIDLITEDIKRHLGENIISLFDITDVPELKQLFKKLYSVSVIQSQEKIQRNRKKNAFKRYIEFRQFEQETNFDQNQPELDDYEQTRTEGGKKVIASKVAERDPRLRKDAIKIHGTKCQGCGFSFGERYGSYGDGFIEIHHIHLLSANDTPVDTNPKTDLIPLCSNCHRMVHRKKNYVMSLAELRKIIVPCNG